MNIKRVFGALLTILGIGGLIFTAIMFVNSTGATSVKALIMYGVLALIFFTSGIGLVRTTKDEA
jgi:predicted Na+-dependent transporter